MRFDGSCRDAARRSRRAGCRRARSRSSASPPSPSASCMPTPIRRTRRAPAQILRRGCAGPVRVRLGRRVPEHARVRALDHDHRQRLHAADVRPLPGATGEGPGRAGLPRPALHHGLQRRHARPPRPRAASRCARSSRAGRRRADERLPRPQPRAAEPAVLRHGRHHRQGRAGARTARRSSATTMEVARVHEFRRAAACPSASPPST